MALPLSVTGSDAGVLRSEGRRAFEVVGGSFSACAESGTAGALDHRLDDRQRFLEELLEEAGMEDADPLGEAASLSGVVVRRLTRLRMD